MGMRDISNCRVHESFGFVCVLQVDLKRSACQLPVVCRVSTHSFVTAAHDSSMNLCESLSLSC